MAHAEKLCRIAPEKSSPYRVSAVINDCIQDICISSCCFFMPAAYYCAILSHFYFPSALRAYLKEPRLENLHNRAKKLNIIVICSKLFYAFPVCFCFYNILHIDTFRIDYDAAPFIYMDFLPALV